MIVSSTDQTWSRWTINLIAIQRFLQTSIVPQVKTVPAFHTSEVKIILVAIWLLEVHNAYPRHYSSPLFALSTLGLIQYRA